MARDGSGEFHEKASASASAVPCHLLELTVISAQDLFPATARTIGAYATAWVYPPDKKLSTRTDQAGHTNPTWNDKLVFRVDDAFLLSPTSAITIDIFAARRRLLLLHDTHLGTVRVLLSGLRPKPGARCFAAFQVRRPSSLRPQGILNVAVALLDGLTYVDRMVPPLHDRFGVPYAFSSCDDLETLSLERREGETSLWVLGGGGQECVLEKSGSVESWVAEKEQEALASKLQSWKLELSPDCYEIGDRRKRRRPRGVGSFRSLSCFCGGNTRWA